MLEPLPRIDAVPLLRRVDEALIPLLRQLDSDDWHRLAVGSWRVRDVAAHLLDGSLRRLALDRDRHRPPANGYDLSDYDGLVAFLDHLNATWIDAAARLSPRVITELLAFVNPQVADYLESLDPEGRAAFPVRWAGESESKVWMDIAREFTERWHHQRQIREAVGAVPLDDPLYIGPLLETFSHALPRAYDPVSAERGVAILFEISDIEDLAWGLVREDDGWVLGRSTSELEFEASIRLPAGTAWRLFTRSISPSRALAQAECEGDDRLVEPFFAAVALMV